MSRSRVAPARPGRPVEAEYRVHVRRSAWLTPRTVRVVLGGPALATFPDHGYADRCVTLAFPHGGGPLPRTSIRELRSTLPRSRWPAVRTYTVRSLDPSARELTIDVVVHGTTGVAGPWAASARPGDEVVVLGPRGSYTPRDDVDAHVLIGDETVLPAMAVACGRIAPGVPVHVVAEVDDAAGEIALESLGDLAVRWVHRADVVALADVVRDTAWPPGRVQAFVHGEAGTVRSLRRHVLDERGVGAEFLSSSGYWRRGADAEAFQAEKRAELRRGAPRH